MTSQHASARLPAATLRPRAVSNRSCHHGRTPLSARTYVSSSALTRAVPKLPRMRHSARAAGASCAVYWSRPLLISGAGAVVGMGLRGRGCAPAPAAVPVNVDPHARGRGRPEMEPGLLRCGYRSRRWFYVWRASHCCRGCAVTASDRSAIPGAGRRPSRSSAN
jgi:hypothetical protein